MIQKRKREKQRPLLTPSDGQGRRDERRKKEEEEKRERPNWEGREGRLEEKEEEAVLLPPLPLLPPSLPPSLSLS